jgi:hypothetical protein
MTHPYLDLEQFTKDHPPHDFGDGAWRERETHELHLRAGTRIRIAIDEAAELGYGLARHDVLADAGLDATQADARAFAERLNATLGQHLSIFSLNHVIEVLTRARDEAEALRQEAIQRGQSAAPDAEAA